MMITLIITTTLLSFISIFLFIRGISLVKRNEMLEDVIVQYDLRDDETKKVLELMLQQMKEIDIKGSFEADDEVGSVFTQLKNVIETYNNIYQYA
jgi:hypothetical protein